MRVEDTVVSGNTLVDLGFATLAGGAVHYTSPYGTFIANRSALTGNRCPPGIPACIGGITIDTSTPTSKVRNTTISANGGTGLQARNSSVMITHSTIVENGGTGLEFIIDDGNEHSLWGGGSIFADNALGDCGTISDTVNFVNGGNLDSDDSCGLAVPPNGLPATDPQLYPLGYYSEPPTTTVLGGLSNPTPSHHPMPGSPVIDAAKSCNVLLDATLPATPDDQDSYERPDGDDDLESALCDIGSVEVLPCSGASDLVLSGETLVADTYESCTWIQVLDAPVGPGESVTLRAREPIQVGNGFSVGLASTLAIGMARDAGWSP